MPFARRTELLKTGRRQPMCHFKDNCRQKNVLRPGGPENYQARPMRESSSGQGLPMHSKRVDLRDIQLRGTAVLFA